MNDDWYYWTRNHHCHFIKWKHYEDKVADANVKVQEDGTFSWAVIGPCWSLYQEKGVSQGLEDAQREVDERVGKVIAQEYKEEGGLNRP